MLRRRAPLRDMLRRVRQQALEHFAALESCGASLVEQAAVDVGENLRRLIGGAAQHDAVDVLEMACGFVERWRCRR